MLEAPPTETATDASTSEDSASISVWMFPFLSAVGRIFRMIPYCLYWTVNWLLVISGIGSSPPAKNSACSPLAQTNRGLAKIRPSPSLDGKPAEKSEEAFTSPLTKPWLGEELNRPLETLAAKLPVPVMSVGYLRP